MGPLRMGMLFGGMVLGLVIIPAIHQKMIADYIDKTKAHCQSIIDIAKPEKYINHDGYCIMLINGEIKEIN